MGHFIEQQASKLEGVENVRIEKRCSNIDMGSEAKFDYMGMEMLKNRDIAGTSCAGFEHEQNGEAVIGNGMAVHLRVNS